MQKAIQINPQLEVENAAKQLAEKGRVQITDFFTAESAQYLYQLLQKHQHWYFAYNENGQYFESPLADIQALNPQQRQLFMNNIYARARNQFQYAFIQYYITQAIELGEQIDHPMHQMHYFMNSEPLLDFMRKLTGEFAIKKADSYASCYSPGHFLTEHDDRHHQHDRVAAYVFSMNPNWNKNWGGQLAFFDEDGNIEQAYNPSFNTLNLFLIPTQHAVLPVAPYAGASRLSYLGWLHR
ncbi:2OG-Fe(II) oxygenase [Aliikangiella maris]|uniref:2OG-Fe(II) oxygenase family protein n=2 Tax=Aliikangiella maris TaxID=3162458 RepID=A0ABV2BY79_9GAMM